MSTRTLGPLLALATAVTLVTCTEVGTDPDAAIAIELDPPQLPALVVGDSLRDSTGRAVPLAARALNFREEVIPDAPIRFLALDTGVITLDSVTGFVVGRDTGQVAVLAAVSQRLQSAPDTVRVTIRPDSVFAAPINLIDTLEHVLGADTRDTLTVTVGHDTTPDIPGDTLVGVRNYLVRFAIVAPPIPPPGDSTQVQLVNEATRPSSADTTDASGVASRVLRLSRAASLPAPVTQESVTVTVDVSVARPDASPVPGSPVRFSILLRKPPTTP